MKAKEMIQLVERTLDELGVADYRIEHGRNNHPRALFEVAGQRCMYVFAGTPSDPRSAANAVAGVARVVRRARAGAGSSQAQGLVTREPGRV